MCVFVNCINHVVDYVRSIYLITESMYINYLNPLYIQDISNI